MINTLEQSENFANFPYSPDFLPVSRTVYALCDNLDQKISTANFIVSLFKRIEELEEKIEILENDNKKISELKVLKETKEENDIFVDIETYNLQPEIVNTVREDNIDRLNKLIETGQGKIKEDKLFEIRGSCNEYYREHAVYHNDPSVKVYMWNEHCKAGIENDEDDKRIKKISQLLKACGCAFKGNVKKLENDANVSIFDSFVAVVKIDDKGQMEIKKLKIYQIKDFSPDTGLKTDVIPGLNSLKCLTAFYLDKNCVTVDLIMPSDYTKKKQNHVGYSNKDMIANGSIFNYQEQTTHYFGENGWKKDTLDINTDNIETIIGRFTGYIDEVKFKNALHSYNPKYEPQYQQK